jgi:AcrR family transcriptional regulator
VPDRPASPVATAAPTRRERLRNETLADIKRAARRQLVQGGAHACSLRAIARDLGMSPPGIYRYFPSLDALIGAVCDDLYDELATAIDRAGLRATAEAPLDRIAAMARGFREWSLGHPAEFALMFGNPVPAVAEYEQAHRSREDAGARFGGPFLAVMTELWRHRPLPTPPADELRERLGHALEPYQQIFGEDLPIEVVYIFLTGWTRLYGLVALEVFGHLRWAVTDVEPLFETELATFMRQLG